MDIQELVRAQRAYFLSGATRPYAFRMEQLKKLQQALRSNEALLEQAMYQDFRKAPMEVYMCETGMVLEELRFHLKHLKGWMRERAVPTPLAQFHAKSFVSPEPYGVALIISPWNYPVQLCLSPLVGAISGGNCAIVKPSAYAPATSAAIAKLIAETFDPRYIAAVEGGRAENSALLSQRFDTIFFTGSVAVGKVVMEAAAKNLTPVTLELGAPARLGRVSCRTSAIISSSGRQSQTTTPFSRIMRMFSSRVTMPPPVAITASPASSARPSAAVSCRRKPASPSSAKISGMDLPAARAISSSKSMSGRPIRPASSRPIVLLPHPIMPMSRIGLHMGVLPRSLIHAQQTAVLAIALKRTHQHAEVAVAQIARQIDIEAVFPVGVVQRA